MSPNKNMEVQNYHVRRRFFGTVLSFGAIGHVLELWPDVAQGYLQ